MDYKLTENISIEKFIYELNLISPDSLTIINKQETIISSICTPKKIIPNSLCFTKDLISENLNAVIITENKFLQSLPSESNNTYILTSNPRLIFILAIDILYNQIGFQHFSSPSEIHPTVKCGENVVIEDGCIIGENVIIEHNTVIHNGPRIGKNSRIRANSNIGGDGFGFERLSDGTPIRFQHLGGVIIGENVEIGALNSIVRGTLSDTIIGDYVKTDNLVHIAHNCFIGDNCLITACAELSGGITLGKNVWIGPNVSLMQKITIGDNSIIGLGAVVLKSVPNNCVYAGNPARFLKNV